MEQKLHPVWHSNTMSETKNIYTYNVNISDLADHGGIGVDLTCTTVNDSNSIIVKSLKNEGKKDTRYQSKQCCAPFLPPVEVTSLDDPCLAIIAKSNQEERAFCKKFNVLKQKFKKENTKYLKKQLALLNQALVENSTPSEDIKVPESYMSLARFYPDFNSGIKKSHNLDYSNGCLNAIEVANSSGEVTLLVHPRNKYLVSTIIEKNSAKTGQHFYPARQNQIKLKGGNIYQVVSQNVNSKGYCWVRQERRCQVLSMEMKDEFRFNHLRSFKSVDRLSSICGSVHVPGEFAVASYRGHLKLYTLETGSVFWEGRVPEEFGVNWSCDFGAHPRSLVCLNESIIQEYDLRTEPSRPKTLLKNEVPILPWLDEFTLLERNSLQDCQYFVASMNHLILVDERFPNNVVMKWNHMLESPPLCSSSLAMINLGEQLFFLSSQGSRETCCFQLEAPQKGLQPTSLSHPWHLGKPDDFCMSLNLEGTAISDAQRKRSRMSTVGMVAVRSRKNRFTIFHLSSIGDVYHQDYEKVSLKKDKEHMLIETETSCEMKPEIKEWLDRTNQDIELISASGTLNYETRDLQPIRQIITKEIPMTEFCPVCLPVLNETTLDENLSCEACGINMELASNFLRVAKQNRVLTRYDVLNAGPVFEDERTADDAMVHLKDLTSCADPLSLKMLAAWSDETPMNKPGGIGNDENQLLELLYPKPLKPGSFVNPIPKSFPNSSVVIDLCGDGYVERIDEDLEIISASQYKKTKRSQKISSTQNMSMSGF